MSALLIAFGQGAILNAGLIIAIGAQNAFVLSQGLKRNYVWTTTLVCSVCDVILIIIGIFFADSGKQLAGDYVKYMLWAAAAYLIWFGIISARAIGKNESLTNSGITLKSAKGAIMTSIALSLLNPHAIIDMTVIFGGISTQFEGSQKIAFAIGGMLISLLWFLSLGFGAAKLSPLLNQPLTWRIINGIIALMMFAIAASLLHSTLII